MNAILEFVKQICKLEKGLEMNQIQTKEWKEENINR